MTLNILLDFNTIKHVKWLIEFLYKKEKSSKIQFVYVKGKLNKNTKAGLIRIEGIT